MKTILAIFFILISLVGIAPEADSIAIKEVDSLTLVAFNLLTIGALDKALEVNTVAEKIANEKLGTESELYGKCCHIYGNIFYSTKDFLKAEKWWLEAKSIREKVLGIDHLKTGQTISNLSAVYYDLGMYDKSEVMQLEAIRIMELNVGKDHPHYAHCIGNLGKLYQKMENYEKAEPLLIEALVIRKNKLSEADPALIGSQNDLAGNYYKLGNYEKAEMLFLESLEIMERITNTFSQNYLVALGNLGLVYRETGKYQKAEQLFIKELKIKEALTGIEDVNYCGTLINLGNVYEKMGDYEQAQKLFLDAKDIFENRLNNRTNEFYMDCLFSLADLYRQVGNYAKAELFFSNVLELIIPSWGKRHSYYNKAISNLGLLYGEMGDYKKAEQLFIESIDLEKELVVGDSLGYAYSLTNLANIYLEMGNYSKAERNFQETLKIFENVLGRDHPDYAGILNNLATIYNVWGQMDKAEQLLLEALAIKEASRGKMHPDYAISLTNLGVLYFDINRLDDAKVVLEEALSIRGENLGKTHPDYAQSLNNLGNLNRRILKPEMAEKFYLEAMEIWKVALGKNSPIYSRNMIAFSTVNAVLGKIQYAEMLFNEMTMLDRMHITNSLSHLSEKELDLYLKYYSDRQEHVWAFLHYFQGKTSTDMAYDNALFHKGFLLNASKGLNHFALSDSVLVDKFQLYKSFSRRLANQYSKPISERDSVQVAHLEEKINTIEKDLARSSEGFKEALQQVNWKDVGQQLHQGEAAIEFIHYKYYDFQRDIISDSMMYTALIVLPNAEQPLFIPLFEEKLLIHLLDTRQQHKNDYVKNLYALAERDTTNQIVSGRKMTKLGGQKQSLYELIWDKIEAAGLKDVKTIYYAPSGILHRLNMGAIAINEQQLLSDRYHLVAVNSTRQLVAGISDTAIIVGNNALVYGGIQFEADTTEIIPINESEYPLIATRSLAAVVEDSTLRGGTWQYLHWTQKEAEVISSTLSKGGLNAEHRSGLEATEEGFKTMGQINNPSPRVLHIATHGFFFPDPAEVRRPRSAVNMDNESVFKWSANPMIRSGLILSGGNYAWQNGKPVSPEKEDGILTAYEISQMNLSNTELVVLSACETGLGDIQGNEGVYGLQRAFKIAGAKYLIMSLWQVPDRETMEFMTAFYKNWLDGKMSIPEAFRRTQKEMREKYNDVYSWGAFVLLE